MSTAENISLLKVPPHSLEAEQAVLGTMLVEPSAKAQVAISADDLYRSDHRIIYRAMQSLDAIDVVTVAEALDLAGELENVGGMDYLMQLADVPSTANIKQYCKIVRDRAKLRAGISLGHEIADAGFRGDLEGMWSAASRIKDVGAGETGGFHLRDLVKDVLTWHDDFKAGKIFTIKTGIYDLDRLTSGLFPGNQTVLAARTSVGKTATAMNIAVGANCPVEFVSCEQSTLELAQRAVAMICRVPQTNLRGGRLLDHDRQKITSLKDIPDVHITDRASPHIDEVEQIIRRAVYDRNCKLAIVDYLQYVRANPDKRYEEVGEVSRRLKALSKELNIHILALAQLNRQAEGREPSIADLRECGDIEQDADNIILLYKESDNAEEIKVIMGKNRHGPKGFTKVGWHGSTMRIVNLDSTYGAVQ